MVGKLLISIVVLLPVLAHVGYAVVTSPTTNYYVTVDEYRTQPSSVAQRIGGQIAPGSIQWDRATQTMRFQLAGESAKLDVTYRGAVPDSFRDGVTAIVEGRAETTGGFLATSILIKCPHQYLPAS
jgi:cytochrome c-type biogenesis protein CcmE